MTMHWHGVMPAVTTPFLPDLSVDYDFFADHCRWLVDEGCAGIVAGGSLGEGATLSFNEKAKLFGAAVEAVAGRVPVIAGISALGTREAVELARMADAQGVTGLMILPPYVYVGDWREMQAHVSAIIEATPLSSMLYNNPVAYKTDFIPTQIMELLDRHSNLHAVKESSADVRRVSALRVLAGDRLQICCGVDDAIVEAIGVGAIGWIAGLANAFPRESVQLFDAAMQGHNQEAFELYKWFLPLLRMDTVPKFVQLIKLVQQEIGMGNELVRPPRLELSGSERRDALEGIQAAVKTRSVRQTA